MRMKKTGIAVLTGKAKIMTVVFALTVFIIGIGATQRHLPRTATGIFMHLFPKKALFQRTAERKIFIMPKNATVLIQRTLSVAASLPILTKIKGSLK